MYHSNSQLIEKISRLLFPFILLFGVYIILFGDQTPGGGFQGGAIVGTTFFISYIIKKSHLLPLRSIVIFEKVMFLLLVVLSIVKFFPFFGATLGAYFPKINRYFLILLNIVIGAKVASGFMTIFSLFIEEGDV